MKKSFFTTALAILALLTACSVAPTPEPTPTPDPLAEAGKQVFKARCATCHALEPDTAIVGPSLAGIATHAATRMDGLSAEEYIQLSIMRPDAYIVDGFKDVMPKNFGTEMTSEDLNALLAFLLTLK